MREVADGVLEIPLGYVNAHLVVVDDGVVLVDTGLPGRSAKFQQALHEARRTVGDVHTILLTHWHPDHTGSAAELKRLTGARVVAHRVDAAAIAGPQPIMRGLMRVTQKLMKPPEPVVVDELVSADGPLAVPGFRAVHTPGHTPGHVSFLLDRARGVLFAGDAAAGGPRGGVRSAPSIVTDDMTAARASLARLAELEFDVAVFGHGRAIAGGAVARFRERVAKAQGNR